MQDNQQNLKSEKKIKERFHRKVGKHNTTKPLNCRINLNKLNNDNKENLKQFEEYDSNTMIKKNLNQSNQNIFSKNKENPSLQKEKSQKRLNYTCVESKYSKKNIKDNSTIFIENRRLNETTYERGKRTKSVEYIKSKNDNGKYKYSVSTYKPQNNVKYLTISSDKKNQDNQVINPKPTLPFIQATTNKYENKTFAIPSITQVPIEIKKQTKPEIKTISHKQIGIFSDLSKLTLDEKKNENQIEEKTIIRRRKPNFPKYERRISDKNITVSDNPKKKEEKEEQKFEKVEKHEQAPAKKRRRSIGPALRREKTKHFQEITSKTYINITEAISTAGRDDDGLTKINQDTYILEKNINGILNFNIFGVLDGHGVNGHFASQFVKRYILSRIKNHPSIRNLDSPKEIYKKLIDNGYKIIANIFLDADIQITKEKFNCEMSGTTCVIVIQLDDHLICANTGDSRAILVYEDKNSTNLSSTKIYPLSYDCKPELPNEKKRIEECGGSVEQIIDEGDIPCGPFRVWIKGEEYPGLAMSRSIGDMDAKKVGVIPNPQIIEYNLNPQSKYMLICSDGIWEFISNEECMTIANRYYLRNDAIGLCNDLTNISTANWLKEDIVVDDITCVVVFF